MQSKERCKWEKIYKEEMKDEVKINRYYEDLKSSRCKVSMEYLKGRLETLKQETGSEFSLMSVLISFAALALTGTGVVITVLAGGEDLNFRREITEIFKIELYTFIFLSFFIIIFYSASALCKQSKIKNNYLMLEALKRYEQKNAEGATLYTVSVKEKISEESQHR